MTSRPIHDQVVIIDNYDSFTYNLVHLTESIIDKPISIVKNDQVDLVKLEAFTHIILSPGPGVPDEAGQLKQVIQHFAPSKVILGVCLGLQAMGEVFGASLNNLNEVYHGVKGKMIKTPHQSPIFRGIESPFYAGRYHSWVVDTDSDTSAFVITAYDEEGQIMAFDHRQYQSYGVQFHPESIMTDNGKEMMTNFLSISPVT